MMKFSELIFQFRVDFDLTQQKLADILGVTPAMVYQYESERSRPSRKNRMVFKNRIEQYRKEHKKNV